MPRFNNFVGIGSLRTATPQRPDGEPVQTSRIRHNLRAASNLARFRTAGERIVASRGLEQRLEPMRDVWKRLRSEEHKSELQSLMRTSYAVFCLKKKQRQKTVNK